MEAIILAGGLGTRLGELTRELPKPMVPVRGRPFLEYLMDYWIQQGIRSFILSVGYKHEAVSGHFGASYQSCPVRYCVEKQPLGTGGGLVQAVARLETPDPFLALNGDTFFAVTLAPLRALLNTRGAEAVMALFSVHDRDRYEGVELGEGGRITGFVPRDKKKPCPYANGGVYVMKPSLFHTVQQGERKSLESDFLPEWVRSEKKIFGYPADHTFIDIGTPEDYARADRVLI